MALHNTTASGGNSPAVITEPAVTEVNGDVLIDNLLLKNALGIAAGKPDGYEPDLTVAELAAVTGEINLSALAITDDDMAVMHYLTGVSAIDLTGNTAITSITVVKDTFDWTTTKSIDFTGCTGIITINDDAFRNCAQIAGIIFPDSLQQIGSYAFYDCEQLSAVTLPDSVMSLGDYSFCHCSGLVSVVLPAILTDLPTGTFFGAASLSSIALPPNLQSLGNSCFRGAGLISAFLPDSVTSIGSYCFAQCGQLVSIRLSANIQVMGEACLCLNPVLAEVMLPNGITELSRLMFNECPALQTLALPSTLTVIRESCFTRSGITFIALPEGVTELEGYCFNMAHSLTYASIPSTMTTVGSFCFAGCVSMGILDLRAASLTAAQINSLKTGHSALVLPPGTDAGLSPAESTIHVEGGTIQLTTAIPAGKTLQWGSSNQAVATVTNGVVTPVHAGTTIIGVRASDTTYSGICHVTVTANANADLQAISLSGTTLNETFEPAVTEYTATIANNIESITVTAQVADTGRSTLDINGTPAADNTPSGPIPLSVGENTITILVTAQDGVTQKMYAVTVTREYNDRADLTGIMLSEGTLAPSFSPDLISYQVTVDCETDDITFTVTALYPADVTIEINGIVTPDNTASSPVRLYEGDNPVEIHVATLDGTAVKTYTVNVVREDKPSGPSGVLEWLPAPGQFCNTEGWGAIGPIEMPFEGVSLGSFGGYAILKFDIPLENDPENPYGVDFVILGNAFSGWHEPGAVAVMKDTNGNGLADDTWYDLAGSEYFEDTTWRDYTITYTNTDPTFTGSADVLWADNHGRNGVILANEYHTQPYYPDPANYPTVSFSPELLTFSGILYVSPGWTPAFGYFDAHPNGSGGGTNDYSIPTNPYDNQMKADPMDISWAVDENGAPVYLEEVSFVKVSSDLLGQMGSSGDISPEYCGFCRVKATGGVAETDDIAGITLVGASSNIPVSLIPDQYVYNDLKIDEDTITISLDTDAENIFINNTKKVPGEAEKVITLSGEQAKTVRVIVQDGVDTPKIYYLSITRGDPGFTPETDKSVLLEKIQYAQSLVEADYKPAGWGLMQSALAAALAVYDDPDATQAEVNTAAQDLDAACRDLVPVTETETIYVSIVNTTFTEAVEGIEPDWTGVLLDRYAVSVGVDAPMMDAVVAAADANSITLVGAESNYISSINGLAEFDGGGNSGWMGTLNDWFINQGFCFMPVEDGDEIAVMYTCNRGEDLGGTWNNNDTKLLDLSFSAGTLSPGFSSGTHSYTLTLPAETTGVSVTPTATNKNFQVRTYLGVIAPEEAGFKRWETIPVTDGAEINVRIGDPSWPTMNEGSWTATDYTITVVVESTSPDWDVNGDGTINYLDLIRIGNHYGENCSSGWIPEDVNRDGIINYLDMILTGNHYGE